MTKNRLIAAVFATSLVAAVAACGGKKAEPPPAKPADGSPVAFETTGVTPGEDHKGAVAVRVYNFSDKPIAQYMIKLRYHDAGGALLKVKPGTPFEADFDHWSMSGKKYKCDPASWCAFDLDHLDVPPGAAKADVVATDVYALADDGMHIDDKSLFHADAPSWPAGK